MTEQITENVNGVEMPTWVGVKEAKLHLIDNMSSWRAFHDLLMQQKLVACDTETSGFQWFKDSRMVGASFGWKKSHFYVPFRHEDSVLGGPVGEQLHLEDVIDDIREFFAQKDVFTLWHNWKFDAHFYQKEGVTIHTPFHDTRILWHLYDENAQGRLKAIASGWKDEFGKRHKGLVDAKAGEKEKEINVWRGEEARARRKMFTALVKETAEELSHDPEYQGFNKTQLKKHVQLNQLKDHELNGVTKESIHYGFIPIPLMCEYAGLDTFFTYILYQYCMKEIGWTPELQKLYINEIKLARALKEIEENGVHIDADYLRESSRTLQAEEEQLTDKIKQQFGEEINLNSTQQLAAALQKVGVPLTKETDTGALAVDKSVLTKHAKDYPVVDDLLRLRAVKKLRGTYVDSILDKLVDDKILHCDFNQNVATGRMSSKDPNLQNIPGQDTTIRKAFICPSDDYVYVLADYSQVEVRLTAHYSQDPLLLDAYVKDQDIHTRTMCEMFGEFYEEASKILDDNTHPRYKELTILRTISKRINFGIIYGVGAPGLSQQIPRPDAFIDYNEAAWVRVCQDFIDNYMGSYLGVKRFVNQGNRHVKKHGQMENYFGRVRRLPHARATKIYNDNSYRWLEARAQRQGVNFLIQGTAADLFKIAVVRVFDLLKGKKSKIVNLVHDEIQIYLHKSELYLLKDIKNAMEDFDFTVPIVADFDFTSTNWADKKGLKT